MHYTAQKVKNLGPKEWYKGTALYKLNPPVSFNDRGYLVDCSYVIVAVTPRAVDHGQPETTIFAANQNGSLFGDFSETTKDPEFPDLEPHYIPQYGLDDGAEYEQCRIHGKHDHAAALDKLGYKIITNNKTNKMKTSESEANNCKCPRCGDKLTKDHKRRGFVRHKTNPNCPYQRGEKD